MAHLPPRGQELTLIRYARVVFLIAALAAPTVALAQDSEVVPPDALPGFLEVSPRLIRLNGEGLPLLGLSFALQLSGGWSVAGTSSFLIRAGTVEDAPPLPASNLRLSYWGIRLERGWALAPGQTGAPTGFASVTAAAGNAQLQDQATKARLRADNFLVLEPALGARFQAMPNVSLGLTGGYRIISGVNGLEGIGASDLRGWSLGGFLRLGPF